MSTQSDRVIKAYRHYDRVNFWGGFFVGVTVGILLFALFLKWLA